MTHRLILISTLLLVSASRATVSIQDISSALKGASEHDARLFLESLSWSHKRSHTNLVAQKATLEALGQQWYCYQNMASTRLNPSKQASYPEFNQEKFLESTQQAVKAVAEQQETNTIYARLMERIIKEGAIKHKPLQDLIVTIRAQARTAVAAHIISFNQESNALPQDGTKSLADLMSQLTASSFVQFDKQMVIASDLAFAALFKSQLLYTKLWNKIETARAAYYHQLFVTTRALVQELGL